MTSLPATLPTLLILVGSVLLVGSAAVRASVLPGPLPRSRLIAGSLLMVLGATWSVGSTLLALGFTAAADVRDYLQSVAAGRAAVLMVLSATLLLLAGLRRWRRVTWAAIAFTVWGMAGLGHGSAPVSGMRLLHAVHSGAMCVWLGGVLALLADRGTTLEQYRRFSPVALASVLVLAISGVVLGALHVGRVTHLTTSDYGLTLIWKVGVLVVALLAAWRVRTTLSPVSSLLPGQPVRRLLVSESVLLLGVLILTARLVNLSPP